MLVILSQKVDTASSYSDELFNSYHYPAKYRNQLHEGDIFIYYQGNRHEKATDTISELELLEKFLQLMVRIIMPNY